MPEFLSQHGTDAQCEAALTGARWPNGFACPRCAGPASCSFRREGRRYWQRVKARTAQANQIRGLLAEFGLIIPKDIAHIAQRVPELIEDASNELPGSFRLLVQRLMEQLKELDRQAVEIEAQIAAWHRDNALSRKLAAVPGIGPITASALVATVGDAKNFANGRQLAAWLGLVPRQNSSGGVKKVLLGSSKRGDTYLRTLLIHGARSVIFRAAKKATEGWLPRLIGRRSANVVAAVALVSRSGI